jgi:hypothetical protein
MLNVVILSVPGIDNKDSFIQLCGPRLKGLNPVCHRVNDEGENNLMRLTPGQCSFGLCAPKFSRLKKKRNENLRAVYNTTK